MSSNVTKRTLSAGLGVGALALLAPRASADTPFSSFAFPATGAPTARTLPDQLGELKNVKDFGARGNGSTNDTAAIQAAVNRGGTIYFPPGAYRLTSPIILTEEGQYDIVGARAFITGNFNGYLFDCPDPDRSTQQLQHVSIQNFVMKNDHQAAGAGCIRITGGIVSRVEYCHFEAWRPITFRSMYGGAVRDCTFRGLNGDLNQAGIAEKASIAIYGENSIFVDNCDINSFYDGVRAINLTIRDTRIEMCYRGVVVGVWEDGNDFPGSVIATGLQMEANTFHIFLNSTSFSTLRTIGILGDPFAVPENPRTQPNDKPGQCGILIVHPSTNMVMESILIEGQFQDAGIKFNPPSASWAIPLQECVLMAVRSNVDLSNTVANTPNAARWKGMEFLDRNRVTFMHCNNP